jgi:hypothetical protein
MALLQIKNIKAEDFGSYKCKVADDFGESEAIVQLNLPPNKAEHRATPPETSMECWSVGICPFINVGIIN